MPTTASRRRCRPITAIVVILVRRPEGVTRPDIDRRQNALTTRKNSTSTTTTSQRHLGAVTHAREPVSRTAALETPAAAAMMGSSSAVTPSRPGFAGPTSGAPPTGGRSSTWKNVSPTWNASGCHRQSAKRVRRAPGCHKFQADWYRF